MSGSAQHFRPATHLSSPKFLITEHESAIAKSSNFGRSISADDSKMITTTEEDHLGKNRSRSPWRKKNPFHRKQKGQSCHKLTKAESEEIEEEEERELEEELKENNVSPDKSTSLIH